MYKRSLLGFIIILILTLTSVYADGDAILELDKDLYEGVSDHMVITLTAPALNKDIRVSETVFATISTSSSNYSISLFLTETGINTGVFSNTVFFTFDTASSSARTIKVRPEAVINVQCAGETAEAAWIPYDAVLEFDSDKQLGLGASPKITLTDYDLSTKPNELEEVVVLVSSSSDTKGVPVKLSEDKKLQGVFEGYLKLSAGPSNEKEGILHIEYNNVITAFYTDKTNSKSSGQLCTADTIWTPQTAVLKFSKDNFIGLNSKCRVTVIDNDRNLRKDTMDTITVKVKSDSDPKGINLKLYETNADTGIFSGDISFSSYASNEGRNTLMVGPKSDITVVYYDDWDASNNRYTYIEATTELQLSEGVLTTSNNTQSGQSDSIIIVVRDPDMDVSSQKNTLPVKITSSSNPGGMTLWLEETGTSSGAFKGILYFSEKVVYDLKKKDISIVIPHGEELEISYYDTTTPQGKPSLISGKTTWAYQKAEIKFNKDSFIGLNSIAYITVTDSEANKNTKNIDRIKVKIATTSIPEYSMLISETSANSGQFKGTLYFGRQSNQSKGILKAVSGDSIRASYDDQGEYSSGTVEASAVWNPQDGELKLDANIYYGNEAEVDITLKDWDVANSSTSKDSAVVSISVVGKTGQIRLPLTETGLNTGIFTGTIAINSSSGKYLKLRMLEGEEIEVTYLDADNTENKPVERKASAVWELKK